MLACVSGLWWAILPSQSEVLRFEIQFQWAVLPSRICSIIFILITWYIASTVLIIKESVHGVWFSYHRGIHISVVVMSMGTGWGLLENGTRLIPSDRVSLWGTRGIKYVAARSTPKVCGMDFHRRLSMSGRFLKIGVLHVVIVCICHACMFTCIQ